MKIAKGTIWARKGAPELRVIIDSRAFLLIRYRVLASGVSGGMAKRRFLQQFEPYEK